MDGGHEVKQKWLAGAFSRVPAGHGDVWFLKVTDAQRGGGLKSGGLGWFGTSPLQNEDLTVSTLSLGHTWVLRPWNQ